MKNHKKKVKKNNRGNVAIGILLGAIYTLLSAIIYSIITRGFNVEIPLVLFYSIYTGTLALFVLMALINLIVFAAKRSRLKHASINDILNSLEKRRRGLENPNKKALQLKYLLFVCRFYTIIIPSIAALQILLIMLIMLTSTNLILIAFVLGHNVLLVHIIYTLLPKAKTDLSKNPTKLDADIFPTLHASVQNAATLMGITKPFCLHIYSKNTITITEDEFRFNILIGKHVLRLLSREELTAVMIHEFSHVLAGDLNFSKKISTVYQKAEPKSFFKALCGQFFSSLEVAADRFELVRGVAKEVAADQTVKQHGKEQHLVNALAKLEIFSCYLSALPIRSKYDDSAAPTSKTEFRDFLRAYEKKGYRWRYAARAELPGTLSTHPTCSERMKNLKVIDFDINFLNFPTKHLAEIMGAYTIADMLLQVDNSLYWASQRIENYVPLLGIVKDFETKGRGDLYVVCDAYFNLCRYDKALHIVELLLALNPHDSFALYKKGLILCDNFLDEGVEYIKKAIDDNLFYYKQGIDMITGYLTRYGHKSRFEELKEWIATKRHSAFVFHRIFSLKMYSKLVRHGLDSSILDDVKKVLFAHRIRSCYILTDPKVKSPFYILLLSFPEKLTRGEKYALKQYLFNTLCALGASFYLVDINENEKLFNKSKKTKGARVI